MDHAEFLERRRRLALQAALDLTTARAELELVAPPELVENYTRRLIDAVREKQSPMWGRRPGDIDPNGYIDPDPSSERPPIYPPMEKP